MLNASRRDKKNAKLLLLRWLDKLLKLRLTCKLKKKICNKKEKKNISVIELLLQYQHLLFSVHFSVVVVCYFNN